MPEDERSVKYRREVDGLRALALIPVILFHAGFQVFRGGFVGVDIFFVISGYLITSIILEDLQRHQFSIVKFYERRARRILPALFTVMAASSIFAYLWMLPDELKNFGESVVATTLFSNNLLLAFTSSYWSLASEFKPLLHTWSLGVEEQFYLLFPLLLIFCWAFLRKRIGLAFAVLAALSFVLACWGAYDSPDTSFYILPARAWELLAGAATGHYLCQREPLHAGNWKTHVLSLAGLLLLVVSVFVVPKDESTSQIFTVFPVIGTVLVILAASGENAVGRFLGSRVMVGVGLISYSCYLWHQPLLAFARVYSRNAPGALLRLLLVATAFVLSYFSWKFIEQPCRDHRKVPRNALFGTALAISLLFVVFGLFLNRSYGAISRIYDPRQIPISALDKRIYNERVMGDKLDHFSDSPKLKVLVLGDSRGRDYVNMTTETFDMHNIEIIYRDDFEDCIVPFESPVARDLYSAAQVIVIATWDPDSPCVKSNLAFASQTAKHLFFIGPKEFGSNLNWVIRLKHQELPDQYNQFLPETMELDRKMAATIPAENYISLLAPVIRGNTIPITDENGLLISTDRMHVTKFGAIYFGSKVLMHSRYGDILSRASQAAPAKQAL